MNELLQRFNQLQARIKNAEIYMDKTYNEKWTGEKLENGIKEREKHVLDLQNLFKEQSKILKELSKGG